MKNLSSLAAAAAIALLGFGAAPADAQDTEFGLSGVNLFKSCLKNQSGTRQECACVTGFFAGAMDKDAFMMMSVVAPFIDENGEVPDIDGAQAAAYAEQTRQGMSDARFDEVMGIFAAGEEMGDYADDICVPVGDAN
ncbi:MAG: hypothetical protein R3C52_00555 [Hyphomonadaceae bacterium]